MPIEYCKAILFDLDGVLVDSTAVVERIWRRWAARHSLSAEPILRMAHGRRNVETLRAVAPHLPVKRELDVLGREELKDTDGLVALPGAFELLRSLSDDQWAIVTSGSRALAELRLRHVKLPLPRILIAAEDVGRGKPDRAGYIAAAKRMHTDPGACIVIEDSPPGIQAGRSAGMVVIGLCTTHGPTAVSGADYVISTLAGLTVDTHDVAGARIAVTINTT